MLDSVKAEAANSESRAQFPVNLMEAEQRGIRLFSQTSELTTNALRGIFEHQTELLRLEAQQFIKAFSPITVGKDIGETIAEYYNQVHEQTDLMIDQLRQANDVIRDYGWRLLSLYAEGYHKGANAFWEKRAK